MYSPHSSEDISLTLITMAVPAEEAVRRTPSQSLLPVRTALHTISSTQLLVHNINLSSSFLNLEIAAARDSTLAGSSKIERVLRVLQNTLEIISTSNNDRNLVAHHLARRLQQGHPQKLALSEEEGC